MNLLKSSILVLIVILSPLSQAQDMGLSRISYPEDNMRVHLQFTYDIDFTLMNYGTAALPSGTLLSFDMLFDGTFVQTFSWTNPSKINAGDSVALTINNQTFSTANPTIDVCLVLNYTGNPNKSNDSTCSLLRFSIDNNIDLGPYHVDITIPEVDSIMKPGELLLKIDGRFKNFGTVTLPKEYKIEAESKVFGNTKQFKNTMTSFLDTGETYVIGMVIGQNVTNKEGPFQICLKLINNVDDKNSSNDEYCQTFYAYDWTGVAKSVEDKQVSYVAEGALHLNNFEHSPLEILIFNSVGQISYRRLLLTSDPRGSLNISNLGSGVYILKVIQSGEVVHSNKFSMD